MSRTEMGVAAMKRSLLAVAFVLLPGTCSAAVIASMTLSTGYSLNGPDHRVRPTFGYDIGNYATQRVLFDDVWIDSTSVGSVLVATAASDTDFTSIAYRLTDGVADVVTLGTCEAISCKETGSVLGEGAFFGLTTPDLGPAQIEKISLRVDALSFGLAPRGEAMINYTFTVIVEGQAGTVPVRGTTWGRLKASYR